MSYTKGKYYTYCAGGPAYKNEWMVFQFKPITEDDSPSPQMPMMAFDELCAMRWAEMTDDEKKAAQERAVEKWSGNVGCDALCHLLGKPGSEQFLQEHRKQMKEKSTKGES
jgi:hypothetical protein